MGYILNTLGKYLTVVSLKRKILSNCIGRQNVPRFSTWYIKPSKIVTTLSGSYPAIEKSLTLKSKTCILKDTQDVSISTKRPLH